MAISPSRRPSTGNPPKGKLGASGGGSRLAPLAPPLIVIVLLAGFYWAVFAPPTPADRPKPSPTLSMAAQQPTQGPTLGATLTPMLQTPTISVLPVLALTTPSVTPQNTPGPGTRQAPVLSKGARAMVVETGRSGLNLRSDAGKAFPKVASVPEGFIVEVLAGPKEADGLTWYQVKDETGATGWGAANFLTPTTATPG